MPRATKDPTTRDTKGRFQRGSSGNPAGRPQGSRNRATIAALELLDGHAEALTSKAVELALAGDMTALRLCLERLIPNCKDLPISIDIKPESGGSRGLAEILRKVLEGLASGDITPRQAADISKVLDAANRGVELVALEQEVGELQSKLEELLGVQR